MHVRSLPLVCAIALATAGSSHAQFTERVSVVTDGLPYGSFLESLRVSDDGRYVVCATPAGAVPEDTNGLTDVYLHDRSTGITELLSKNPAGFAGDSWSNRPVLDADGSTVAFLSGASDLVAGTSGYINVYALDRTSGTLEVINVDSNGVYQPECVGNVAQGSKLEISADGRFVYYTFRSKTLVPGLPNCFYWGFARDRLLGLTTMETRTTAGNPSFADDFDGSDDGRFVVFQSMTVSAGSGSGSIQDDVYLRNTVSGKVTVVNVSNQGAWSNGVSLYPSISGDGNRVAFLSFGKNLVPDDTNNAYDVFVYDRPSKTIQIASVSSTGEIANLGSSWALQISKDGNRVAFSSNADNLTAGDTNNEHDVFVRDLAAQTTVRVSEGTGGVQSAFDSFDPDLSGDGSIVTFANPGGDLVPAPPPTGDWYLSDLNRSCPPVVAYCTAKTNSAGCAPAVSSAGVPTVTGEVAFFATARDVVNGQTGLFFWGLAPNSAPFVGGLRCVAGPLVRTRVQSSGGSPTGVDCTGSYSYLFDTTVMSAHGLTAGTTVYGQFWSLDPGSTPPFGLTDGLQFTLCP